MEKGKCYICGTAISPNAIGYCYNCANDYYKKRDEELPFVVRFGDDEEEFRTETEANDFCDKLHAAYVERKEEW